MIRVQLMKTMKADEFLEGQTESRETAYSGVDSAYSLNIAGVYQDSVTRDWAMQVWQRAAQPAGERSVQSAWYNAHRLNDPALFQEAVCATLAADVIIVSVYAADELPPNVYAWVAAWLPRRRSRMGALTALVGVAEPLGPQSARTIGYLEAVARRAQLEFIAQERQRTVPSLAGITTIAGAAAAGGQLPRELPGQRCFSYYG